MNPPAVTRHVLVFADTEKPGLRVAAKLRQFEDHFSFKVLTAADPPAVKRILQSQAVAAMVIEVGREMGYAVEVLRMLGKGHQSIPLFVYNGFILPKIAGKTKEYDHVRYCEDHRNFDHFLAMILAELSRKKRGIIHGIALGNFLQLMNKEKFSGQIIVTAGAKKGVLFIRAGQLIGADMNGSDGNMALSEMSSWEKVTVEIEEKPSGHSDGRFPLPKNKSRSEKPDSPIAIAQETHAGRIDILRFSHQGKRISVDIHKLNSALQEIQGLLADELLRMDIFLSMDGRSLAGWNSHPLACSTFAAITECLMNSLEASHFPRLGNYYLLDLAEEHLVVIMVTAELQWGMLLKGGKERLGFLLNIIMPKALKALAEALMGKRTV